MQTILPFHQTKSIIERRAKKGINLLIEKQKHEKSFHVKGIVKTLKVTTYTVKVNQRIVYELPGDHIPYEFIKSGWQDNDVDLLLSQFAIHIDSGSKVKMHFQLDEHAPFFSKTGEVEKSLLVRYCLAKKLYHFVRLGSNTTTNLKK